MTANVAMPSSTATAKKSCRKPSASQWPTNGMWKSWVEQHAVGLEVDRAENEEAPHREEVRDAGDRPLQQSGLPEDLCELGGDARAEVVFAAVSSLIFWPERIRFVSHSTRLAANTSTIAVSPEPDDEPDQHWVSTGPPDSKLLIGNLLDVTGQ